MGLHEKAYKYLRGDGVPVASPLFQGEGGGAIPTSPLQLHFEECSVDSAMQLNALWHSRLPNTVKGNLLRNPICVCFWATFDNAVFAVAIWTTPVAANRLSNGWNRLELRRFAVADNAPNNTASRFLGWMARVIRKKYPNLVGLVSYQDTEVHSGTIYKAAGWVIGNEAGFAPWMNSARVRHAKVQSDAPKIRWELSFVR